MGSFKGQLVAIWGSIISLEGHLNAHTVVENSFHSEGFATFVLRLLLTIHLHGIAMNAKLANARLMGRLRRSSNQPLGNHIQIISLASAP